MLLLEDTASCWHCLARSRPGRTAMPASVGYLVIDTTDPSLLVPFWCGLLDVQVDTTIGDGQFVLLTQTADGLTVGFQRVPDAKSGKNRLHLDLIVDDLDSATAEVQA